MDMFGGLGAFSPMGGPTEATPQNNPFTKQSTAPIPDAEEDDEWEYEYSTTETETYYVTLDLTNPSDPPKRKPAPVIGRVSARIRWINPVLLIPDDDDDDTQKKKKKGKRQRKEKRYRLGSRGLEGVENSDEHGDEEDEDENSDSEEGEGGGSDSDGLDRMTRAREEASEPQEESEDELEDIDLEANGFRQDSEAFIRPGDATQEDDFNTVQISELHSKEPFVLFRGKYYKCQWHSNIGTELLFMKHDPDDPNPLPSLRTLTGDVDLLAASSARIMSREVLLTPKEKKVRKPRRSRLNVKDLAIDVGKGASAKRKAQAKFLEELINTKLEMGELDGVTVNAVSRKSVWKWNDHLRELNKLEIQDLEKVVAKGGRGAAEAAARIREIEEEMEQRQNAIDGGKKKGGPPAGQKKAVPGTKPRRGRPVKGKLSQDEPDTPVPATPMRGEAASSRGDADSDEMEDSEADSQEGDSEEDGSGEEDSGQEDSGEERTDEEDSEEGDSEDEDGSSNSEEDERFDEDGDEDTTMYD